MWSIMTIWIQFKGEATKQFGTIYIWFSAQLKVGLQNLVISGMECSLGGK